MAVSSHVVALDTQHEDMIHDAQLDYYGKKLATCSSDKTIKIFEVGETQNNQVAEIKGHEGPVWQVAWAHPKFGPILASCGYDRKVCVWKESSPNAWSKIFEYDKHESSVNSISWAPHEFGLSLATGSSDTTIAILTYKGDGNWDVKTISNAHAVGVNAVSWAPAVIPGSLVGAAAPAAPTKRLVSGGCDNLVKIWSFSQPENQWKQEDTLESHQDWVRDVAWAPNIGLPSSTIASCSQDGAVIIWSHEARWNPKPLPKTSDQPVWRLSWSIIGNLLAVSGGDNKVTLWKEGLYGEWSCISSLAEENLQ